MLNTAVPLLAPIALLPLLGVSKTYRGKVKIVIMRSLQEGQLFWTVIAMCAAACYEAAGHLEELSGQAGAQSGATVAWIAIGWHVVIIIASSVLVLLGTMDAINEAPPATAAEKLDAPQTDAAAPMIMVVSVWMSAVSAISFGATHLWAS
ncbi:MAG TPA: hypothetical protein DCW29_11935 [Janthinobacterium sp.]|nr:hypothetical protein [Janthinobacterium sp.]